jgi:hypothetical protein
MLVSLSARQSLLATYEKSTGKTKTEKISIALPTPATKRDAASRDTNLGGSGILMVIGQRLMEFLEYGIVWELSGGLR